MNLHIFIINVFYFIFCIYFIYLWLYEYIDVYLYIQTLWAWLIFYCSHDLTHAGALDRGKYVRRPLQVCQNRLDPYEVNSFMLLFFRNCTTYLHHNLLYFTFWLIGCSQILGNLNNNDGIVSIKTKSGQKEKPHN